MTILTKLGHDEGLKGDLQVVLNLAEQQALLEPCPSEQLEIIGRVRTAWREALVLTLRWATRSEHDHG